MPANPYSDALVVVTDVACVASTVAQVTMKPLINRVIRPEALTG